MSESTSAYVIPDFEKDAAAVTAYEEAKSRLERREYNDVEARIQAQFAKKREQAKADIAMAASILEAKRAEAKRTLEAYGKRFPARIERNKPLKPSFWESLLTFGLAGRMYHAVTKASLESNEAQMIKRRKETEEEDLDTQLRRQLHLQEEMIRRKREAPNWADEVNARPQIAPLWQKVVEIRAEREAFRERLEAGKVSATEQRDRAFVEKKIRQLEAPFNAMLITGFAAYGDRAYYLFRDPQRGLFALSYDPRLEPLHDAVIDVFRIADKFEVKLTREEGKAMTALDHYMRCAGGDEAGRVEYRKARIALREPRPEVAAPVTNEDEATLIELLAQFARTAAPPPGVPSPEAKEG